MVLFLATYTQILTPVNYCKLTVFVSLAELASYMAISLIEIYSYIVIITQ